MSDEQIKNNITQIIEGKLKTLEASLPFLSPFQIKVQSNYFNRLLFNWLSYEKNHRGIFKVSSTEKAFTANIGRLSFKLKIDRVDEYTDGSMIVIDYNQTFISNYMAETRGRPDVEMNLDLLRHMILNQIRNYRKRFGNEYGEVVIACDNRHYWRRDVYPFYKASRKKSRDSSGHDWSSIFDALHQIRSELDEFLPYPVLDIDGAEADDVIGALAEYSQENDMTDHPMFAEAEPFLILSGDHDFQQLQKYSNVQQFSPIKKKWVKLDGTPQEVLMEHIISGDKGDGVPNILSDDDTFVTEGKPLFSWPICCRRLDIFHCHM